MFNYKLKAVRESKGILQKDIAKYLDISDSRYNHYENENDTIPIKHLNKICIFFNCSIDYLFSFTSDLNYSNIKDIDNKKSGQRLKEFRKENKLTQKKLALFLNTTFSTISFYERGEFTISTQYLYAICTKYKISADYLLGKIDAPKYY